MRKNEENLKEHYFRLFIFASLLLLICTVPIAQPHFLKLHDISEVPKVTLIRVLGSISLILWALWIMLGKRKITLPPKKISSLVFAFLLSWIISTFMSTNFYLSFFGSYMRQMGFLTYFFYFAIFFMLFDVIQTPKEQKYFYWAMIFSTTIVVIVGLLQFFRAMPWFERVRAESRIISTLGHADFLGHFLVIVMPIILSFIYYFEKNKIKIPLLILFFASFLTLLGSYTRGSWVAFLFSFIVFFGFLGIKGKNILKKNKVITLVLILGMLFTVGAFGILEQELYLKRADLGTFSLKERFESIGAGLGITQANPRVLTWRDSKKLFQDKILKSPRIIYGLGPETFSFNFTPYKSLDLARYDGGKGYPDREHNEFLDILFPQGLLGLLVFCFLLLSVFLFSLRNYQKIPEKERLIFLGTVTGWIGFLVQALVLFGLSATYLYFWTVMSFILLFFKFYNKEAVWEINLGTLSENLKYLLSIVLIFIGLFSMSISFRFFRAEVFYRYGLDYLNTNEAGKAASILEEAIKLRPQETAFHEAAIKAYIGIMGGAVNAEDKDYAYRMGEAHINGLLKNAYYRSLSYNLVGAFYAQAYHYLGKKDRTLLERAEDNLYKAISFDKYAVPPLENLMRLYSFDLKDINKAREMAQRILEIDPYHLEAGTYLASILCQEKNYDEAAKIYENLAYAHSDNKDILNDLGVMYLALGDYEKAEESFLKVLNLDPLYDKARENLKTLYKKLGINKEVPEIPNEDMAYIQLGLNYYTNNNYTKAIEAFSKALEINNKSVEAMNNLGATSYMMGDLDKAILYFEKAIELNRNYVEAYGNLAYAYLEKNDLSKAEEVLKEGLKYNPNAASLKEIYEKIRELKGELKK